MFESDIWRWVIGPSLTAISIALFIAIVASMLKKNTSFIAEFKKWFEKVWDFFWESTGNKYIVIITIALILIFVGSVLFELIFK